MPVKVPFPMGTNMNMSLLFGIAVSLFLAAVVGGTPMPKDGFGTAATPIAGPGGVSGYFSHETWQTPNDVKACNFTVAGSNSTTNTYYGTDCPAGPMSIFMVCAWVVVGVSLLSFFCSFLVCCCRCGCGCCLVCCGAIHEELKEARGFNS